MKANEAPEKIYIHVRANKELGTTWHGKKITNSYIEYVRTDVLLDKLECWMNENFYQFAGEFDEGILAQFDNIEDAIKDFRKYMEGE